MSIGPRLTLCTIAAMLLTAATGYQVNYGANQDITEWSTCKNVANNSPSGKAIFVPTNTNTEWSDLGNFLSDEDNRLTEWVLTASGNMPVNRLDDLAMNRATFTGDGDSTWKRLRQRFAEMRATLRE